MAIAGSGCAAISSTPRHLYGQGTKPGLAKMQAWLSEHERTIDIDVLLIFGALVTRRSLGGLLN